MNVLVEILGKQFKVEKGDKIKIPYINQKIGEKLTFEKILYLDDGKNQKIGKPYVKDFQVEAKLLEHGREDKVIVFKFKRRKGYQKKNGHKQKSSQTQSCV
jgi:large subunit ribosomal protein L21